MIPKSGMIQGLSQQAGKRPESEYTYQTHLKPVLIFEKSINMGLFVHLETEGVSMFAGEHHY